MEPAGILAALLPSVCALVLAGFVLHQRKRIRAPARAHRRLEPHRPAHRAVQPPRLRGAARAGARPRHARRPPDLRDRRATSTAFARSTSSTATRPATRPSRPSPRTRSSGSAASTSRRASAARSSRCSCPRPTSAGRSSSPSACAEPPTAASSRKRPRGDLQLRRCHRAAPRRATPSASCGPPTAPPPRAKDLGGDRTVIYSDEVARTLAEVGGHAGGELQLATVIALAEALDIRDTGTGQHSHTVGRYCES